MAGLFLVAGNIYPGLGMGFYPGLVLALILFSRDGKPSRPAIHAFWMPYSLVLGLAVWHNVFPLFLGPLLGLLIGDLFSRVLYRLLQIVKKQQRLFILPGFLFLIEYSFQVIPGLNKVHMVPFLAPLANQHLLLLATAWWGGPLLLLLLTLTFALIVAQFIRQQNNGRRIKAAVALAVCLALLILPTLDVPDPALNENLQVAALQGSFKPAKTIEDYNQLLTARLDHYRELAEDNKADITVFPELEFGLYDIAGMVDEAYRRDLADTARAIGGVVVITVTEGSSVTQSRDDRYFSALVYDEGQIIGLSRKRNLVPFSESRRYSPGRDYSAIDTGIGAIGVSICYDINALTVEKLCHAGAKIILAPFNDSGFNRTYYNIHRFYPVLRAASCAVPIVVANEDGISQIIDRQGRILKELGPGRTGLITASVSRRAGLTIYLRFGIYLAAGIYGAVLLLFAVLNCHWYRNKRKDKNSRGQP